jgi:hypothetical protein
VGEENEFVVSIKRMIAGIMAKKNFSPEKNERGDTQPIFEGNRRPGGYQRPLFPHQT